ncbi:MAG: hypothetical protein Q9218_004260 [Villophora microphyllina]
MHVPTPPLQVPTVHFELACIRAKQMMELSQRLRRLASPWAVALASLTAIARSDREEWAVPKPWLAESEATHLKLRLRRLTAQCGPTDLRVFQISDPQSSLFGSIQTLIALDPVSAISLNTMSKIRLLSGSAADLLDTAGKAMEQHAIEASEQYQISCQAKDETPTLKQAAVSVLVRDVAALNLSSSGSYAIRSNKGKGDA